MTHVAQEHQNENEVRVKYYDSSTELGIPLSGDLASLLNLQEMKEVLVHGKPILFNAAQIDSYLESIDSAIDSIDELGQILESQISKEDVEKIYKTQLHRKIIGQEFRISEIGEMETKATEEFKLLVPEVKVAVEIVEEAIESIASDDLSKYMVFLPPTSKEEELNPIRCVTGNTLRVFLNEMQEQDSGLDMNAQILVYAKLLTLMPDEDPTKKYGLTQMRMLMQYGDVVSNKNLRLSLTHLLDEGSGGNV